MNVYNIVIFVILFVNKSFGKYEPTWESLDSRALPDWYDDAKIGIFIHWGVYSVPSFGSEWFWYFWKDNHTDYVDYVTKNYPETWTYQQFAKDFTAELFDPDEWAQLFANSGAKYVVLTTKHHEGYTLWPSKYSYSWNSVDVGPSRDIVGEVSEAVRKQNLTFGVYHSLFEWFNPLHISDKASNLTRQDFINDKVYPEMLELVEKYKPSVFWSDGDQGPSDTYWKSKEFLAWLYNDSPVKDVVVTNDRWGDGTACTHGGFFNCDDRYNPGSLQKHKWENAMTIDKKSWGYRRNASISDFYTIEELLKEIVSTVSCGGNVLMNIGPRKDGTIAAIFQERLQQTGTWLSVNGEAIYGTKSSSFQNDTFTPDVWYTTKASTLYAIALHWPQNNTLVLESPTKNYFYNKKVNVYLLGNEEDGPLQWSLSGDKVTIEFPDKFTVKSQWAYAIKICPVDISGGSKIGTISFGAFLLASFIYFLL